MPVIPNVAKEEMHQRRKKVANWYCEGVDQCEMAQRLGVSDATISTDLRFIRDEWLALALVDFNDAKARQLAKIDHLEEVTWMAWYRSTEDAQTTSKKVEEALRNAQDEKIKLRGKPTLLPIRSTLEIKTMGRNGDVRFLQQIAWCIEMRLKLMGLLKEDKGVGVVVQINWDEMHKLGVRTSEEIEQKIAQAALPSPSNGQVKNGQSE
jgi:transposase